MSADAPPPSPDLPTPGDANFSDPLPQKRRYKKSDAAGDEIVGSEGEILVLSSLLQALLAKKQETAAPPGEQEARTRINRFGGKNPPTPAPAAAEFRAGPEAAAPNGAAEAPPPGVPAAPAGPVLPKLTPRAYQPDAPARRGRSVLYFAFTAAVAIAAFLVGRGDARRDAARTTAAAPPPAAWTAGSLALLDQVLAADQSGDIPGAQRLAADLQKQLGGSPALDLYLRRLDARLGNTSEVENSLTRQLVTNPPPLTAHALNEVLAFDYDRARDFIHADETFAVLTGTDPFSAADFYQWGDTLRRKGAMPDAIEKFRQALLRLPADRPELASQRECAELKIRLAQIENGHGADIQPAIEEHLRANPPSGYWLLTAGAAALQRGDYPAAVDALQRARTALSPGLFGALTDDYFFHAFSHRTEVAGIIPPEDPANQQKRMARAGYFVDP